MPIALVERLASPAPNRQLLELDLTPGAPPRLRLRGELDIASGAHLNDVLDALGAPDVVIDLSGLRFIDAAGLSSLLRAGTRAASRGAVLQLTNPSQSVTTLFDLVGVPQLLDRSAGRADEPAPASLRRRPSTEHEKEDGHGRHDDQ